MQEIALRPGGKRAALHKSDQRLSRAVPFAEGRHDFADGPWVIRGKCFRRGILNRGKARGEFWSFVLFALGEADECLH